MFGFVGIPSVALHKKSWAVIDRPYSLGCATVGALYERPRCIFCAKRSGRAKTRQETRALIRWRVFVSAQPGRNDREDSGDQRRAMGRYQLYGLRLQMLDHHPQLSVQKPLSKMCFRLSYRLRVPLLEEPGYFVHLFLR